MKRHYYLSDDLDELQVVEQDLEAAGVTTPQIHILSEDDAGVVQHHLHDVEPVLRKDVVHGTEIGAVVGVFCAAVVLGLAWVSGIPDTITWVPPVFLAVIVLGFCTWEGGLIGIQEPHSEFRRFEGDLQDGKHVLFVDIAPDQLDILQQVVTAHPKLAAAGEGGARPAWVLGAQNGFARFMKAAP